MNCPYCGKGAILLHSSVFYGKDYGNYIYLCRPCDAYVGTHRHSKRPLGTMANAQLRILRRDCHKYFDRLWKGKGKQKTKRDRAYEWLQEVMDLSPELAHIGMFDVAQCRKLLQILEKKGIA